MSDYLIRNIDFINIEEAFKLVKNVFMEFDAPDYSKEGIDEVMDDMLENKEFKNLFKTGEQIMIGAIKDNKIIGGLAIGANNHISLVFVDKNNHKNGIAKALINEMVVRLKDKNVDKITLNSTPYAIGFYQKVGFISTGPEVIKHGVKYTPMEFIL